MRVLVIDDSSTIRRSAEIFLKQAGHEVVLAENGFEGLAMVSLHKPQIIFCDVLMPKLDGYQVCMLVRNNPAYVHTPIVMLSSKDSVFDMARGLMVGSQAYLTKPFTKEQLMQAIAHNVAPTN